MDRFTLGWSQVWDHHVDWRADPTIARVIQRHKDRCRALTTEGDTLNIYISGRTRNFSLSDSSLPSVGDWCLVGKTYTDNSNERAATLEEILPRHSKVSRMASGVKSDEQILAANVDIVMIVSSIDDNFNINRIRRFVMLARHGKADPVVVLSKADRASISLLIPMETELKEQFPDVECIRTSAVEGSGLHHLGNLVKKGSTAIFVGSSGVGKSTLVNALLHEEVQRIGDVRAGDGKGKHTTSASGLFFIPNGGMIIDTPGLREVGMLIDNQDIGDTAPSVKVLSEKCQYRDCTHSVEPGCCVLDAMEEGYISASDYQTYRQLEREAAFSRRKLDRRLAAEERKKRKLISQNNRRRYRDRHRQRLD